jgi:hypothetical protein
MTNTARENLGTSTNDLGGANIENSMGVQNRNAALTLAPKLIVWDTVSSDASASVDFHRTLEVLDAIAKHPSISSDAELNEFIRNPVGYKVLMPASRESFDMTNIREKAEQSGLAVQRITFKTLQTMFEAGDTVQQVITKLGL